MTATLLADFMARTGDKPTFMVEGIVHSAATMLYGGPKAGKSWLTIDLAAALVRGQEDWLGRKIAPGPHVVAFATTDPGSARESADRLTECGLQSFPIYLIEFDRAEAREQGLPYYDRLADEVCVLGVTVLFFDNIFSAIAGDTKEQKDASVLLDGLNRFIRRGVAVVAVHHTSKGGPDSPARTPTGSQAFAAWARSLVRVEVVGGSTRRRLYVSGNQMQAETVEVDYTFEGGVCSVGVVERADREQRDRSDERRARDARLAGLVVAVPADQAVSKAGAARYLYDTVTGEEAKPSLAAWKTAIARLETGGFIVAREGGGWKLGNR